MTCLDKIGDVGQQLRQRIHEVFEHFSFNLLRRFNVVQAPYSAEAQNVTLCGFRLNISYPYKDVRCGLSQRLCQTESVDLRCYKLLDIVYDQIAESYRKERRRRYPASS